MTYDPNDWKPGDVALIDEKWLAIFGENERLIGIDGIRWETTGTLTLRRLVVIDPEDREQVQRLAQTMDDEFGKRGWANHSTPDPDVVNAAQAALREFESPTLPRPDEPLGIGAVVRDEDGDLWQRDENDAHYPHYPWWRLTNRAPGGKTRRDKYRYIAVTAVEFEGVTE